MANSIRPQCVLAFWANKLLVTAQPESRFGLAIMEIADSFLQDPVGTLNL